MRKTLLVMRQELITTLRRKSFLIFGIGIPLVLGLIALIVMAVNQGASSAPPDAAGTDTEIRSEGFVDPGGLIEELPEGLPEGWLIEYPDEATANAALEAGTVVGYWVIPADYVESGELIFVAREFSPLGGDIRPGGIEWLLIMNALGDPELAVAVQNPLTVKVTSLAPEDTEDLERGNWIVAMLPSLMVLILYMVILLPAGMLTSAVVDEKKNRVMEILVSSISAEQMITGKILALGLLGLLQTALWVGVLWVVAEFGGAPLDIPPGFSVPTDLLVWSFVYGLLGYCMYGAQMAGIGAVAPDVKNASGPSMIVLSPLIIAYSLSAVIHASPDGPFALAVSFFPLTGPVGMIARMTRTTVPVYQAALAAALQLITAVVIVRASARLFRAQHLLSGKAFSVGRYFRILVGREP